ncbi:MAG: hypothetical protein IT540_13845, partial [Hyphomicrobium sp.]|nr:hypothetical protein [Hyphomicrobium sp.]
AEDQGGIFFRTGLGAGYGHYLYTETARNGGGPVLGSSFLIGYRLPMGLVVGGSLAFEPILLAWGQHSRGGGWGPSFGPGGYGGLAIGYARDLFEIDITVGFGGGGVSGGAGGFGLMVVPSFGVHVLSFQQLHIGLFARPTLGLLVDVNTGRFLVYPAGTIGVSVTYY